LTCTGFTPPVLSQKFKTHWDSQLPKWEFIPRTPRMFYVHFFNVLSFFLTLKFLGSFPLCLTLILVMSRRLRLWQYRNKVARLEMNWSTIN
jgi:hypothetical protein